MAYCNKLNTPLLIWSLDREQSFIILCKVTPQVTHGTPRVTHAAMNEGVS